MSRPSKPAKPGAGKPHRRPAAEAHTSRPRLFYALRVPVDVTQALALAQQELRGNWRAVQGNQLHVTLAYLPAVDLSQLDDLKRLGTRLAQHTPPLSLKLRGTGYFPNEGSPRVWFVKVEAEGLSELAAQLREGLADLGVKVDENFKAHVTLARKKGPAPRVPPKLFDLGWDAGALTLYRSHLKKTGPVYENLSMFKFCDSILSSTESGEVQDDPEPASSRFSPQEPT